MKCDVDNCWNEATWRPIVNFFPGREDEPFTMEIGACFCTRCKNATDITVEELLDEEMQARTLIVAQQMGAPPPDFKNARLEWFPLVESTLPPHP